jgi:hypothetical protein
MFFKIYGQIAAPLTTLLKKEAFSLTKKTTLKDFVKLKEVMCTGPVLAMCDFKKFFIVECDALRHGIGAVLM